MDKKGWANARDHYGHSPLHKSIMANQEEIMRFILGTYPDHVEDRDNVIFFIFLKNLCSEDFTNIWIVKSEQYKLKINFLFYKKFKNWSYFFTCISPDYVAHDITKEFWKNIRFENMRGVFLLRWQNSLRREKSLICHWIID